MPSPPAGTVHTEVAAVIDGWTVVRRRRRQASELPEARNAVIRHMAEIGSSAGRPLATARNPAAISARWRMTMPGRRRECGDRRRYRDSPPAATTVGPPRWRRIDSRITLHDARCVTAQPHNAVPQHSTMHYRTTHHCTMCYRTMQYCNIARSTTAQCSTATQHDALPHNRTLARCVVALSHDSGGGRASGRRHRAVQTAAGSSMETGWVVTLIGAGVVQRSGVHRLVARRVDDHRGRVLSEVVLAGDHLAGVAALAADPQ